MTRSDGVDVQFGVEDLLCTPNNIVGGVRETHATVGTPYAPPTKEVLATPVGYLDGKGRVITSESARKLEPSAQGLDIDSDPSGSSSSSSPNPSPISSEFTWPTPSPTPSGLYVGNDAFKDALGKSSNENYTRKFANPIDIPQFGMGDLDDSLSCPLAEILPQPHAVAPAHKFILPTQSTTRSSGSDSSVSQEQIEPCANDKPLRSPKSRVIHLVLEHMPGISPLHLTPECTPGISHVTSDHGDPPPHISPLPALPLPSTPKLEQSPEWNSPGLWFQPKRVETPATYLAHQRQLARLAVARFAILPEPQNLPPFKPTLEHLDSSPWVDTKTRMGAYGRRVNLRPRVFADAWWEPYRRGGVIDRTLNITRTRRMQMWEEALRAEQARTTLSDAKSLIQRKKLACRKNQGLETPEIETQEFHNLKVNGETQALEYDRVEPAPARAHMQDEVLLREVIEAILNGESHSSSKAPAANSCAEKPTDQDEDTMQTYVEKGDQVSRISSQKASGRYKNVPGSQDPLRFPAPRGAVTAPLTGHRDSYAPRTKSPLNQSYVAPPPVTRIRVPSICDKVVEVPSTRRTWRKFASMIF